MTLLTLTSEKDSYVDSANPATTYGTATTMILGTSTTKICYLDFDMEQVPDDAWIQRAILRLYQTAYAAPVGAVIVYPLGSTWGEYTICWNVLPTAYYVGTQDSTPTAVGAWGTDVTMQARLQLLWSWSKHFGFFLGEYGAGVGTCTFATREHATAGWRPTLDVQYFRQRRILPRVSGPTFYGEPRFAVTTLQRAYTEGMLLDVELVAPGLGVSTFDLVFPDATGAEERLINELVEEQSGDCKVWLGDGGVWWLAMRGLIDAPGNVNTPTVGERMCEIRGRGYESLLGHRRSDTTWSAQYPTTVTTGAFSGISEVDATKGVIESGTLLTINGLVLPNVRGIMDVVRSSIAAVDVTKPWQYYVCDGDHDFERNWLRENKPTLHLEPRQVELSSEVLQVGDRFFDWESVRLIRNVINQCKTYYNDMASDYTKNDTTSQAKYTVRADLQWLDAITSATEAQNWTDAYVTLNADPPYNIRILPGGFTLNVWPGESIIYRDWTGDYLLRVARVVHRFSPQRIFTEWWIN